MTKAFQATYVSTVGDKPSAPVILNFADESGVNSSLLLDTPKSVVQAVKEVKKEIKNEEDVEEKREEVKIVKQQEVVKEKEPVQAPAQVEVKEGPPKIAIEPITVVVPITTVNNGFTTDGVNAILTISSMKGTIVYKVKADTSATFTITTIEGTAQYPLNFGDKLRVNIIQK